MKDIYQDVAYATSRTITRRYSTSFALGTQLLNREVRSAIYGLYGFVRLADEIVDSFHNQDKHALLAQFHTETYAAIERGLSLNPVLHSFQEVANRFCLKPEYIEAFFRSMEMDLYKQQYDRDRFEEYVFGSAEVVGLMCLQIFCKGDEALFLRLEAPARRLGAAFQKVNFLRDLNADYVFLGRTYFPNVDLRRFDERTKREIEAEISADFQAGLEGIRQLPHGCKLGVYVAYVYYLALFRKIKASPPARLFESRVRVPNRSKLWLMVGSYLRLKLRMV